MRLVFLMVAMCAGVVLSGCTNKPVCNAASCAGCCDQSGKCQLATDATCGLNGNACMACGLGTTCNQGGCVFGSFATGGGNGLGGGSSGVGGGSSAVGGGSAMGGGTATDAGPTGGGTAALDAGRVVHLTYDVTMVSERGTSEVISRFTDAGARFFMVDGGVFTEYPALRVGNELIASGLPAGEYVVRIGSQYIVSTADQIDLSYVTGGRGDVERLDAGDVALTLKATGVPTWGSEALEVFSMGAQSYGFMPMVDAGVVFTTDYAPVLTNRIDATKGDTVWGIQQRDQVIATEVLGFEVDGGPISVDWSCGVSTAVGHATGYTALGPTSTLTMPFVTTPTQTVQVAISRERLGAMASATYPDASILLDEFYLGPLPVNSNTAFPDLLYCNNFVDPFDLDASVTVVNPFPSEWGLTEDYFVTAKSPTMTMGDAGRRYATAFLHSSVQAGQPLNFEANPPQKITLQGVDATVVELVQASAPFAVAWQAPVGGVKPTNYRVDLRRIKAGFQNSSVSWATVDTVHTSFTFPVGTFEPGWVYFVRVEARVTSVDPERKPWAIVSTRPYSISSAMSRPFKVE